MPAAVAGRYPRLAPRAGVIDGPAVDEGRAGTDFDCGVGGNWLDEERGGPGCVVPVVD